MARMAPPMTPEEFAEKVLLEIVTVPEAEKMALPPRPLSAETGPVVEFPENRLLDTTSVPALTIAPPPEPAEWPEKVPLVTVSVPRLLMPPPRSAIPSPLKSPTPTKTGPDLVDRKSTRL